MMTQEDKATISVRRPCELLELCRASLYDEPAPISADDVRLMNVIDEEFTQRPCLGSRQMKWR